MTQIIEEEKSDSSGEHPRHGTVVVGYGRGQFLQIASPYTSRCVFPSHLPWSCIPLPSCELATDQRRKQRGQPDHDEQSSSDVSSYLPVTLSRMARKIPGIGRGKPSKAYRCESLCLPTHHEDKRTVLLCLDTI